MLVAHSHSAEGMAQHVAEVALDHLAARIFVELQRLAAVGEQRARLDDLTGAGWTAYGGIGRGTGQFTFPSSIAVVGTVR